MATAIIELTESQATAVEIIARNSGKTQQELMHEAVNRLLEDSGVVVDDTEEAEKFQRWKEALLKIEGMWADRDDLPDFAELRKSWDRDPWAE